MPASAAWSWDLADAPTSGAAAACFFFDVCFRLAAREEFASERVRWVCVHLDEAGVEADRVTIVRRTFLSYQTISMRM
jgi:hypothetical protein